MTAITIKTEQEKLFELCWHIQMSGNRGVYTGGTVSGDYGKSNHVRNTVDEFPKPMRDGMLYYSAGHGWRVRKNPHWVTVFQERFPETWKAWCDGKHETE